LTIALIGRFLLVQLTLTGFGRFVGFAKDGEECMRLGACPSFVF